MCDENIAVSVRTLNQMSSILPNRMEKLKLASLAAGIVAGFTTDCTYSEDLSLSRGYDNDVAGRVETLARVLRSYIVLNTSWYNTGARTVSDLRNVFITGRRHPLNTIENIFSLISQVEFAQNNSAGDIRNAAARSILYEYDIDMNTPFYRLISNTKENGLLKTLVDYREHLIKTAKRVTADGKRLDILDNGKIATVISVIAGFIIGYCEPLPTSPVDFEQFYSTTAYPFAMSLLNELVEKVSIDTGLVFNAFRAALETRYELAFEPVATVRGVIGVMISNEILAKDMAEAISNSHKEELLSYIVGMVKGVYDVRKDAAEREVLHELDFLPVNPIHDLVNRPETYEDVEARMEELMISNEAALIELGKMFNDPALGSIKTISNEAMTGTQKMGILFMVIGGALMAWAVYATFFKKAADQTNVAKQLRDQINKDIEATNRELAKISINRTDYDFAGQSKRLEQKLSTMKVTGASEDVLKQITKGAKIQDIKSTKLIYEHGGENLQAFYDFSKFKTSTSLDTYSKFMHVMTNGLLEDMFDKSFDGVKDMADMTKRCNAIEQQCAKLIKEYGVKFPAEIKGSTITAAHLADYMHTNVADAHFIQALEKAEAECLAAHRGISSMNAEEILKALDDELAKQGIDEATRKQMAVLIKKTTTTMTNTFKEIARTYLLLISNIRIWENLTFKHLRVFRYLMTSVTTADQIDNPAVKRVHL